MSKHRRRIATHNTRRRRAARRALGFTIGPNRWTRAQIRAFRAQFRKTYPAITAAAAQHGLLEIRLYAEDFATEKFIEICETLDVADRREPEAAAELERTLAAAKRIIESTGRFERVVRETNEAFRALGTAIAADQSHRLKGHTDD